MPFAFSGQANGIRSCTVSCHEAIFFGLLSAWVLLIEILR
jgi:hypothetical protein